MQPKSNLVLASVSPRRRELLKLLVSDFEVLAGEVTEVPRDGESPEVLVQRLARLKAEAVRKLRPDAIVVGADTVVVSEDRILGKPGSVQEARRMLVMLSGRTHHVLTGVCVLRGENCLINVSKTAVRFSSLSDPELDFYLGTGEPMDKAGAYAIQGIGSRFIERIDGCYFNVVGLPISLLYQMLLRIGLEFNG